MNEPNQTKEGTQHQTKKGILEIIKKEKNEQAQPIKDIKRSKDQNKRK